MTPLAAISRGIDRPRQALTAWVRLITLSGAVAGAPEGLPIGPFRSRQDIRARPHVPGDEHRLPRLAIGRGKGGMARRKGARRPLPVDAESDFPSRHGQRFDLGDVVADVVEKPHPQLPRPHPQRPFEDLPGAVHEELPVGPGVVGGAGHGGQVLLPPAGGKPRAGELAVGKGDSRLVDVLDHPRQVIVADLVSEAAGAAVDHDAELAELQAEGRGGLRIEDLLDHLDLEKVVSRPERPELVLAPRPGPGRSPSPGRRPP